MSSAWTTLVSMPSSRCDVDVRADARLAVGALDPQEARVGEPALAADALGPVREVRERRPGQPRLGEEVVVHPHEAARPTGRAGADPGPLDDDHRRPALGEVEREARPVDAGADDDDVRRVGHRRLPLPPARAGSPSSIGQVGRVRGRSPADPRGPGARPRRRGPPRAFAPTRSRRPSHGWPIGAGVAHPPQAVLVHLAGRSGRVDHDGHAIAELEQPEGRLGDADIRLEPGEHGRAPAGLARSPRGSRAPPPARTPA